MTATATLTPRGQITLPKEVRESLGLRTGDQLALRLRNDGVVEMAKPPRVDLMSLCESIEPEKTGVTVEDMNEAIRQTAGKM